MYLSLPYKSHMKQRKLLNINADNGNCHDEYSTSLIAHIRNPYAISVFENSYQLMKKSVFNCDKWDDPKYKKKC